MVRGKHRRNRRAHGVGPSLVIFDEVAQAKWEAAMAQFGNAYLHVAKVAVNMMPHAARAQGGVELSPAEIEAVNAELEAHGGVAPARPIHDAYDDVYPMMCVEVARKHGILATWLDFHLGTVHNWEPFEVGCRMALEQAASCASADGCVKWEEPHNAR